MSQKKFGEALERDKIEKEESRTKDMMEQIEALKKQNQEKDEELRRREQIIESQQKEIHRSEEKIQEKTQTKKDKWVAEYAKESVHDANLDIRTLAIAKKILYSLYADMDIGHREQWLRSIALKDENGNFIDPNGNVTDTPYPDESIEYTRISFSIPTFLAKELDRFAKEAYMSNRTVMMVLAILKDMYCNPLYEEYRAKGKAEHRKAFENLDEILEKDFVFRGNKYFG